MSFPTLPSLPTLQVFVVNTADKVLQHLAEAAANGRSDAGSSERMIKAGHTVTLVIITLLTQEGPPIY